MSKLGDINSSYGKQFVIAVANAYSYQIMQSSNLPKNTIIVSSPFDISTGEDLGTPALLITDNDGVAVELTKTLCAKNGLKYENDALYLDIDNFTVKCNEEGKLYVDLEHLIGNSSSVTLSNGVVSVNESGIQRATKNDFGVIKTDGITIKSDNGKIYVNSEMLDYCTENSAGIAIGDGNSVIISNGTIRINADALQKSANSYGVAKADGTTLSCTNGILSVNMSYFESGHGLLKVDGITVKSNNGEVSANAEGFDTATYDRYGVVKIDGSQLETSTDGRLSIKSFDSISQQVLELNERIAVATSQIQQIENDISNI